MKKFIMACFICCPFLFFTGLITFAQPLPAEEAAEANAPDPEYAKWASLAEHAARSRYPNAALMDYLYVGCKALSPKKTEHVYKFWIQKENHEFGVYVTVVIDARTQKPREVSLQETDAVIPSYGKWRKTAVQAIRSRFPNAKILDYRPAGCQSMSDFVSNQTFKFWLEIDKKWKLYAATLTYDVKSERIRSIRIKEIRN